MVNIGSVGKKWSEDILFALNDGAKRFNQLMELTTNSNKKINSRILANRLKKMEEEGLVIREIVHERPPATIYKLTNKGKKTIELVKKLNEL